MSDNEDYVPGSAEDLLALDDPYPPPDLQAPVGLCDVPPLPGPEEMEAEGAGPVSQHFQTLVKLSGEEEPCPFSGMDYDFTYSKGTSFK